MIEPRKVDVAYADGRWLAEVAPESLDCGSLQQIIDSAQREWPDQPLIFVVDQSTVEGDDYAVAQFLDASARSGALVFSIPTGLIAAPRPVQAWSDAKKKTTLAASGGPLFEELASGDSRERRISIA